MQQAYDPARVETEAQTFWDANRSFNVTEDPSKDKFYCLSMFPYPSGKLHMGHVRNYCIGDVIARYQRMLGKNVLQPMGWDAFGLPAENAAISNKTAPAKWTRANIAEMRRQLKQLGFAYDWERELATCDPDYYKWEQWLFTRLMVKGLAYRKMATVNWDPVDQTVLANEQVVDGRGWRSGALIEKRDIEQWFIRITDYAQELLDDLDTLEDWPEQVRTMQRNWIGRSVGVEIEFALEHSTQVLPVFTTRPDTLMGVTYMAVAAEHPLALNAAKTNPEIQAFVEECRQGGVSEAEIETIEKKGIALEINALHPITGEAIPVFAANFVLMGYGFGAVMAVPGHDQRDWDFANKYALPIRQVIKADLDTEVDLNQSAYTGTGVLVNSGQFDGLNFEKAFDAIADWLEQQAKGKRRVNYRLRDWGVSRQRYWGCPIPVAHKNDGSIEAVKDLPVELPEDVIVDGSGSPLKKMPEFFQLEDAKRETDTFDTFFESSWYYARYCSYDCDTAMLDERANYWLPVDQYVGGVEHAVLHLLYARFFNKLMRDEGLIACDEPFTGLLTQGMVVAETFYRDLPGGGKQWFNPADVEKTEDGYRCKSDRLPLIAGGIEKMSKSKNNGVDPQKLIDKYGADTVRLYTLFTSPPDQSLEWSDDGVEGAFRFLRRLWVLAVEKHDSIKNGATGSANMNSQDARREIHTTLKKALFDYERQQFNTVVSAAMTIINRISKSADAALLHEGMGIVLKLLAPITPHITHVLWKKLGFGEDILESGWLKVDESARAQDQITYVVQVNGKVRARIQVSAQADKKRITDAAKTDVNVSKHLGETQIHKVIVVPGKLINIVTR